MEKPKCKVTGEDGNIFAVLGRAKRALEAAGQKDKADEMVKRAMGSHSYPKAVEIVLEYVDDE